MVLENLKHLNTLRQIVNQPRPTAPTDSSIPALIRRHGVTHVQCTPTMATMLMLDEGTRTAFSGLKQLLIGGEEFPPSLISRLPTAVGGKVLNMYGPTETTVWSTSFTLDEPRGPIPIGRPIANTQIYIVDRYLEPVPVGVPGELWIGGAGVARGYLGRPELTAERFIQNPFNKESGGRLYRTGDLARYLPDGNIEFLGRLDHQVKIRGYRIELGEIEAVLNKHAAVRESVVIAREDVPGNKQLVAYFISNGSNKISAAELRSYVKAKLPEYMIPAHCVQLEAFPTTPNNKIDREAFPHPSDESDEMKAIGDEPKTPMEKALATVWVQELGLKRVGRSHNFFELGADSLSAVRATLAISRSLGMTVPLQTLLDAPVLSTLAKKLEEQLAQLAESIGTLSRSDPIQAETGSSVENKVDGRPSGRSSAALVDRSAMSRKKTTLCDGIISGGWRRLLQLIARVAPGATSFRVLLHRWRGVNVGRNVRIGYDAIIETAYPWLVSVGNDATISVRAMILAHFEEEPGPVTIEEDAFIGPGAIVLPNVTIGRGAVVAAGSVVSNSVSPMTMVQGNPAKSIARVGVPLMKAVSTIEFIANLTPLS